MYRGPTPRRRLGRREPCRPFLPTDGTPRIARCGASCSGRPDSGRPETATPASACTGPARHHGGRRFVHRAFRLPTLALIRGAPVRRHPAKAEPGASWCAGDRTLGLRPLSCLRAAEATLLSGHPLSRARAVLEPASGARPAWQARPRFRCSFAPRLQRLSKQAYPWGHPVARPATVSSLDKSSMTQPLAAPIAAPCGNC